MRVEIRVVVALWVLDETGYVNHPLLMLLMRCGEEKTMDQQKNSIDRPRDEWL